MMGSVETRKGTLSAVVRVRSPATGAAADAGRSSDAAEPPGLGVRRDGPRRVTVGVPACRGAPPQKETFEVSTVLPVDASPGEIFAGVGGPVVDWLWDGFNAVVLSYGQASSGKTTLLLGDDPVLRGPRSSSAASSGRQSPEAVQDGDGRRRGGGLHADGVGVDGGEAAGAEGRGGGGGGGGGLLRDILRVIFDNAAATTPTAPATAADDDADHPARENENEQPLPAAATAGGGSYDALNPLAGSWSPSRLACDRFGDGFDATEENTAASLLRGPDASLHAAAASPPRDPHKIDGGCADGGGGGGGIGGSVNEERDARWAPRRTSAGAGGGLGAAVVVALSAWEVAGKNVTDLFVAPPSDSAGIGGSGSGPSAQGAVSELSGLHRGVSGTGSSNNSSSSSINSNSKNRGVENTAQSAKSGGGGGGGRRSRSRNGRASSKPAKGDGSQGGGGGGGGCGGGGGGSGNGNSSGRGRRRSSRGRSGSDDSSTAAAGGGWPTGYPEGFMTVRAPSLAVALALVDTAQRRRQAAAGTGTAPPGEPAAGKGGKGGGGGGRCGAAAAAPTAAAAKGHLFFRVVVYNALEETVSTLHAVDLAGGWEPPSEKPAGGRRGSKGSGSVARPSAVSREWNSFDAMMAGLVPPPPPSPPPPADTRKSSAAAVGVVAGGVGAVVDDAAYCPLSRASSTELMPCSFCGAVAGRTSESGAPCCAAEAGGVPLGPSGDGDAGRNSADADANETFADPCVAPALEAAEHLPPPPPPPHPVFGSPKGKTFGGGGGGKLVEALRPLMSGNTRTWLVVSVGGGGRGGPAAAWRALDVARRVAGVSTTCIRLRGVALADLGLRNPDEVLAGNERCLRDSSGPENNAAAPAGGGGRSRSGGRVVDHRTPGRAHPASSAAGPTKAGNSSAASTGGPGATGCSEPGLPAAAAAADRSPKDLGYYLGGGGSGSSYLPSSPATASSLSGLAPLGESLLSLADTPLLLVGEGGGGGGEGVGTSHVDSFLAGFARASGGGGGGGGGGDDEDGRPRRISSGGALGSADVILSQHEEDAAAAWRAIGGGAAEVDAGGAASGYYRSSGGCERGVDAAAGATPALGNGGSDPRIDVEQQQQQQRQQWQHPPPLQGSPLRPGGRAAVVPSTCLPSKLSRLPGAVPTTRPAGNGNDNGNTLARGTEEHQGAAPGGGVAKGGDRRNGIALSGTAVGAAARRETERAVDEVVSPAVSEARGNGIDRMMSSLLEEVLPARRGGEERSERMSALVGGSGSGSGSGGKETRTTSGEGNRRPCPPPPAPPGSERRSRAVVGAGKASARRARSPGRHKQPPSAPAAATCTPLAAAAASACRSGYSTPAGGDGGAAADSNSSGFLTPIEVLMHAPAGGAGHAAAGCPQCAAAAVPPRERCRSLDVGGEEPGPGSSAGGAVLSTNGVSAARRRRDDEERRRRVAPATGELQAAAGQMMMHSGRVVAGGRTPPPPASFPKTDDRTTGGGNVNERPGDRSRTASAAAAATGLQRFGGNAPSDAAADLRKTKPNGTPMIGYRDETAGIGGGGGGNGSERTSAPTDEDAGVCGKIEDRGAEIRVDCLGELEAETGAGAALMRRNHAALLRVLREQEDRGNQMARRFEEKECDWMERVTTLEAQLDGLRAEAVEIRGRLRRAESSSPSAEVFERYEAHAGILEAENTSLRDQNVALELRLLDVLRQPPTSAAAVPQTAAALTPAASAAAAAVAAANPREAQQQKHQHQHQHQRQRQRQRQCQREEPHEDDDSGGVGVLPKDERAFGGDSLRPAATATVARFDGRTGGGAASKFRVDGRVARLPGRGGSSPPAGGGGAPLCAAVLKDLRRRLKETELEAREMRAQKAAAEKRDRLCHAQLRALAEQKSKVRELFLREKEQEASLTASRLASARAEVIADNKAAEVERLRQDRTSLEVDREALVRELAEERRKSRRFDEDRRAYGHIRRFIERHAGGRPAEWDEDIPPSPPGGHGRYGDGETLVGLEGLAAGIDREEGRERPHRRQHHHHGHHHHPRGDAAGVGIGCRGDARGGGGVREYPGGVRKQQRQDGEEEDDDDDEEEDVERLFPGASKGARRGGGSLGAPTTVGRASGGGGAWDTSGGLKRWRGSSSAPRRTAATASSSFAPPEEVACVAESTECLYSEVYRNRLEARFGTSRGFGDAVDAVRGGGGLGVGDGSPLEDGGGGGGGGGNDNNNHSALKFSTAGREKPGLRSSRITDRRKLAASEDDEWASGGGGSSSAPYYGGGNFSAVAAASSSWRAAAGADNTTMSPLRSGWRGLGDEAESTESESEPRLRRSALLASGSGGTAAAAELGTTGERVGGSAIGTAWRSGSRLAEAAAGTESRSMSSRAAGRSFAGGGGLA